jgi:hypothetical protein
VERVEAHIGAMLDVGKFRVTPRGRFSFDVANVHGGLLAQIVALDNTVTGVGAMPMNTPRQDPSVALREATEAALQAQATLEDPGLRAAFAHLQARYADQMRRLPPEDTAGREGAYLMLRALDALATDLTQTISGVAITRRNYRSVLRTVGDTDQ